MEKPYYVEALEKHDAALLDQMQALREFALRDGALPARVKVLMCLLGDALQGQSSGVKALAERARALGATDAEVAETVRLAFYMAGMPGLVTGIHAFKS